MPAPFLPRLLTGTVILSALVAILALSAPPAWMSAHYVAKPLATLAILAMAATAANPLSPRYQRAIVAGLGLSLLGDVLLMLPTDLFAWGLGAFLLAHLCYIAAFLGQSRLLARPMALAGYALVAIALVAAVYPSLPVALRVPVLVYVVVITLMASQSAVWMLEAPSPNARRAAIGAAWFLVSDATLAIARFRTDVPYRDLIVLGTYFIAQWCIATSVSRDMPVARVGDASQ
ncbi:MAG: lysoplasmalogenase [Gemmatimonadaceae bacterium]|nr:lysoplasmalogenase [Gemmatimonadaceae bacterium]